MRETRLRITGLTMAVAAMALAVACSDDDGERPTATQAQEVETSTTTIVPGITKDAESPTATPTATIEATATAGPPPSEPPAVDVVNAFPVLPALERPIELVVLGSGSEESYFLVLQEGRVLWWTAGAGAANPAVALDIRDRVSRQGNEEGLLGFALDPEYLEGRPYAYVYYSVAPGERRTRLARFTVELEGGSPRIEPGSELVILEEPQPYSNHNGGKVAFGPEGLLYVALGDGGSAGDPVGNGQNPATRLGSILRIDVGNASVDQPYAIPPDNPFAGDQNGADEVYAWGLRNPWRFSFDADGRLWAGDVGQGRLEEINLVELGGNYGWNEMEGDECFQDGCDPSRFEAPVAVYGRSAGDCSVTGGVVHDGPGELNGWYLFGDYCTGTIRTFHSDGELPVESEPMVLVQSGVQVASFADDLDGEGVYVLAFDGRIYYVSPV